MDEKLKFREALNELGARATADGGRISREELEKRVQEFGFTEEQLDMVGRYLKAMNIEIDGMEAVGGEAFAGSNEENRTDREPADLAGGNDGGEDADMTLLEALSEEDRQVLGDYLESLEDLARDAAMAGHMRLSAQLALSYAGKGIPLEDLIQEGNVGLIMALDTLELREDGISEAEYIREGIRGAMENLLEEEAGLQKSDGQILERINYIGEAIRNLSEELERKVTLEELSAYLDMPEAEIADVLRLTGEDIKTEQEAMEEQEAQAKENGGQGTVGYASVEDFKIF